MQQNSLSCQQIVRAIRDAIREEAKAIGVAAPGAIKISLVPYNKEADSLLGGFSDFERATEHKPTVHDEAIYEYSYALTAGMEFAMNAPSDYSDIHIKKRSLLSGNATEGATEFVYIWNEFLDITVRVAGANEKNRVLAETALNAIKPFFSERDPNFSVKVDL